MVLLGFTQLDTAAYHIPVTSYRMHPGRHRRSGSAETPARNERDRVVVVALASCRWPDRCRGTVPDRYGIDVTRVAVQRGRSTRENAA